MDDSLKKLCRIVNAPDFMELWLERFYEPREIALLLGSEGGVISESIIGESSGSNSPDLKRSWKRGVLDIEDGGGYRAADFHTRYDIWAMFEGFKDIPEEIRVKLNRWEFEYYSGRHEKDLELVAESLDPDAAEGITPRYLLLDEALSAVERSERVYLWPCNCRLMVKGCKKNVYTCIRFENKRDIGFEISIERAKEIILESNRNGLMQSGEFGSDDDGRLTGAICNCCADCCFPHQLARERNAGKIWPFSRYIAVYLEDQCTGCGLCTKRCPFDAFVYEKIGGSEKKISFNGDLCRGCGLCTTGCPAGAIQMSAASFG